MSPQVYASIFTGGQVAQQRLLRKNLTIFFSDIAGFTDISDTLEPERLAYLINTYLSEMSNIAIEHGGTIDKFIGDAMVVFFGDPETEGDHNDALKCARMALRMRARVAELREVWRERGIVTQLRVRMGINTGFCTVGDFGSEQRLNYTALGGPMNLAARLQSMTEPDSIRISASTHALIEGSARCTPAGEILPKGMTRPVATYLLEGLEAETERMIGISRTGRYVEVNIADSRHVREAIEELRGIQEELDKVVSTNSP